MGAQPKQLQSQKPTGYGLPLQVPSRLTGEQIKIEVHTKVAGFLQAVAIAPKFTLKEVQGDFFADSLSVAGWSARIEVDLRHIEVHTSHIDRRSKLKRAEADHIEQQVKTQLFDFEHNPIVRLDIKNVIPLQASNGEGVFIRGELQLNGVTHFVAFPFLKSQGGSNYETKFKVKQTDYGFVPLSTGGGMIRADDEIEIVVRYLTKTASNPS